MLEQIRNFARHPVIRWTFIAFLVVVFGLFGIDAYLARPAGGDTVASVGRIRIGSGELDNAMREQAEIYRQQFRGQFDASLMDNPEIRRGVLDQLVNEKLVAIGSESAGARIPDDQLAERIASLPVFQVDGRFSRDQYERVAKSQGLTPIGMDERLRRELAQQQFRSSIADTAFVPKTTLDNFIRLSEQTREVSVVNFAPDAYLAKVKIEPAQVKAHYDANPAEFTNPESARVEYVELSLDALAAKAQVPPEEVKRAYEDGMQRDEWGVPEERKASHILVTLAPDAPEAERKAAQAKAQALAEQVRKNPAAFADVARKESQDPGSAAQGGDLGFFRRGAMVKPFEDAVFAAKKGEIVGPVVSDFGLHVILVTDGKPAQVKSLADATPEIEANLKKDIAARRFAETAEQFTNLVYEQSASLKPAAEAMDLTVQQSPWIVKGAGGAPPFNHPKLVAEIFSDDAAKAKRNTSAVEVAPNMLVSARILEHKPAQLRPLEEVRADIERKLQREEAARLAKAEGEARLKDVQAGKDAGLTWPEPLAVNRQKPGGLLPQVIDRVFRVDSRKLPATLGVETPAGYSLVQVTRVIEPEKIEDAQRQALGSQLLQAVAVEELEATLSSLRNRVGVSVNRDAVERKRE